VTLEELHASLPDELRIAPEDLPEDIREGMTYIVSCDSMRDGGTPEDQIPSFMDWRVSRD
jgi:hypothetical protein